MGNTSNCNNFCQKETVNHDVDDLLISQHILPCQICGLQLTNLKFRQHLDQQHFAYINEINGNIELQCLLCNKVNDSLEKQGMHLIEKHPYAVTNQSMRNQTTGQSIVEEVSAGNKTSTVELNKTKKSKVALIQSSRDYQIVKRINQSTIIVSVKGVQYEVQMDTKQFRGADFEPLTVQAEMIWFKVFTAGKNYKYYMLDEQAKQKSVIAKSYLFY